MELIAEIGMGVPQVFAHSHQRLIQRQTDFNADYREVQRVRQGQGDAALAFTDLALQHEPGNEKAEGSDANDQQPIETALNDDSDSHRHQRQEQA